MKIAAAAYPVEWHNRWNDFVGKLRVWVRTGKEQGAELLVFPEYAALEIASLAGEEQVHQADEDAVVIAPLPWLEALRRRPRARMIAAGREAYRDGMKARMLGAQGFIVAPLDEKLLLREVTRLSGRAPAWAVGE